MKWINFSDKTIKWFHSYLSNRAFFVSLDNLFLEAGTLKCRIPQGSILEPLLFLVYKNDTLQALSDSHTYLYLGNTSIFYQHNNVMEIQNVSNKEFANICEWFVDNKLSIHVVEDKAKCIIFSKEKTCLSLT